MTWLIAALAVVLALLALRRARVLARRLDRLTQRQWELQYRVDSLGDRLERGSPTPRQGAVPDQAPGEAGAASGRGSPRTAFVPLSSVRR